MTTEGAGGHMDQGAEMRPDPRQGRALLLRPTCQTSPAAGEDTSADSGERADGRMRSSPEVVRERR